jgi:Winged helix-turn helix
VDAFAVDDGRAGAAGQGGAAGADGLGTTEIVRRVGLSKPAVIGWKRRFVTEGLAGLDDRPKSGRPARIDPVGIVLATLEPPPENLGVTHWSSRLLAQQLGVSDFRVLRRGRSGACSRGGSRHSSSPPTRNGKPRSATWSACT